jgi:hypothetical protein
MCDPNRILSAPITTEQTNLPEIWVHDVPVLYRIVAYSKVVPVDDSDGQRPTRLRQIMPLTHHFIPRVTSASVRRILFSSILPVGMGLCR